MDKKIRIDKLLVDKGFFKTRERSQEAIKNGIVLVNGLPASKPSSFFNEQSFIQIKEHQEHVSRGALKLGKAIQNFAVNVSGRTAIDVGASTGGFTEVLLGGGAIKVAALDVGYGQLDWKLRTNPRVDVFERKNIRYFTKEDLGYSVDLAVIDVSFISLSKIIQAVKELFENSIEIVALVKPQFEAPKGSAKNGVVRDAEVHKEVLGDLADKMVESGLEVHGVTYSPIKGAKGNIEYFFHLLGPNKESNNVKSLINEVVDEAHGELID